MLKITKIVLALLTVVLAAFRLKICAKALFYRQHSACNKL